VLVCVIDPEVAAIVTVEVPAGVVGTGFGASSLQPTMNPVAITIASRTHNILGHAALRRRPASETNGRSNANTAATAVNFRRIGLAADVVVDV
jgi:hypothetical protein